jgi:hypothetical protein
VATLGSGSGIPLTRRDADAELVREDAIDHGEVDALVEVEIHGESFRQDTLEALAGPKGPDGKHVREGVTLRCDPTNEHDPNAVRVEVMGQLVGYVARDQAVVVSAGLQRACGGVLEERGLIVGGWHDARSEGFYGIRVWLTGHDAVRIGFHPAAPAAQPIGHPNLPWPEIPTCRRDERRLSPSMADLHAERWPAKVTVVGEEHYQGAVTAALPAGWDWHYCPALVGLSIAACNPYSKHTEACVEVGIADQTVGFFTPAMTDRYRTLVESAAEAGLKATATATVRRAEKAGTSIWRVQVEMCRVD